MIPRGVRKDQLRLVQRQDAHNAGARGLGFARDNGHLLARFYKFT